MAERAFKGEKKRRPGEEKWRIGPSSAEKKKAHGGKTVEWAFKENHRPE